MAALLLFRLCDILESRQNRADEETELLHSFYGTGKETGLLCVKYLPLCLYLAVAKA